MNIGWFGLGKLGMICSEMIVDKGYSVTGYDINEVESKKVDVVTNPRLAVENKDFVFVAVHTPHDPAYGGETPITHLQNKDLSGETGYEKLPPGGTEGFEFYFDVDAGTLTFPNGVPSGYDASTMSFYIIKGARYIGRKGIKSLSATDLGGGGSNLTVTEENDPNNSDVSVTNVSEIRFDKDAGFALDDLCGVIVRVRL